MKSLRLSVPLTPEIRQWLESQSKKSLRSLGMEAQFQLEQSRQTKEGKPK